MGRYLVVVVVVVERERERGGVRGRFVRCLLAGARAVLPELLRQIDFY
jgi:hypothetical protein